MSVNQSKTAFSKAANVLVGGVNSPVRAFKSVGSTPIFMKEGSGPFLRSVDGKQYIDYVLSWGPMILGHAHPKVTEDLEHAIRKGCSFGTPSELETELAERVIRFFPSIEKLRLVSSGTEATMSALRLARAATNRDIIVKFDGCYHGHADSLLVAAGSGALTHGQPDSPGVPTALAALTRVLPYNDTEALTQLMQREGDQIAAIILEPVAGNMGLVPAKAEFLNAARELCNKTGAKLIFDEVMSGFRADLNGAQALYGIRPDITCLGKVIGGGLPMGAYGGPAELMDLLSPSGPVYQAGTLSGNPIAVTAGISTLTLLEQHDHFQIAADRCAQLCEALEPLFKENGIPAQLRHIGTMWCIFYTGSDVTDLNSAKQSDLKRFSAMHNALLNQGVYTAPSQFESNFLSSAHSENEITQTIVAFKQALHELRP